MEQRMNTFPFQELVVQTLRDPHAAASRILSVNLPREWLWMAMALMCVLNSIVYSLNLRIHPPENPEMLAMIPPAFQSPILFTIFLFGALVITVFVLQWIGEALGGKGSVSDILVLFVWLQVMRCLLQLAVMGLSFLSPMLAGLTALAGSIYAIYLASAFVDRAHGFENLLKALGVIVVAVVAIVVGLSLILSVIAAAILGGTGNV